MKSIKTERIRLGLTQHQLADLTGIPFRTIQNWETGQRKCPEYVEKLVLEKLQRMGESDRKQGQWQFIEEPNTVDACGNKVYYAKCSECGFTWTDLYSVKKYFTHCPGCGAEIRQ